MEISSDERFIARNKTEIPSRCKFNTLATRQPMVEFYLLTFPRFPLRKKEHKSYFGKNRKHDFRTSRCAGYLLDHSGDEGLLQLCNGKSLHMNLTMSPFASRLSRKAVMK